MKMNTKKTPRCLVLAAAMLVLLSLLASCSVNDNKIPSADEYSFQNPAGILAEPDAGFVIDGILDEEAYQNCNWLKLQNVQAGGGVDLAMTSFYGENGLYIVYDITESTRIYVNPDRPTYLNSCVEMYLASSNASSMDSNEMFEIDMLPTGELSIRQRTGKNNWVNVASTDDVMARLGATTKGGPVNSEECNGYNLELFIPWDYLDYVGLDASGMKQGHIYINPVHITSYNYEGTESGTDRYWFSFATQAGGDGWNDVAQYFRFGKDGVIGTAPIELISGDHYTISGNDSVVPGMMTTIQLKPDDNYTFSSIKINGEEYIHKASYNNDGSVTLQLRGEKDGLKIEATAEQISAGNKTLSGIVKTHKLGGDTLEDVSISYRGPGGEKPIELDGEGKFVLKDLAQGYYTITVNKKGYAPINRGIYLGRDVDAELALEYQMFKLESGYNWILDNQNDGVLERFGGSGKILSVDSYEKFGVKASFKYDKELAKASDGDTFYQQRSGIQLKFGNNKYWRVDLMKENGVFKVQYAKHSESTLFNWKTVHELTQEEIAKYQSEDGIELSILRDGRYAWVCLDGRPVAIEVLDAEYADLPAQIGFEGWVANPEIEEMEYDIVKSLDRNLRNFYFTTNTQWNISRQLEGVLTLPAGGTSAIPFYSNYTDFDITLKGVKEHDTTGKKPGRTDLLLEFDTNGNGSADKSVSFGIVCTEPATNTCWIQTLGNADNYIAATRVKGLYKLSTQEAYEYLYGNGLDLRVVRKGTEVYVFVDGEEVAIWDLTQNGSGVTASTSAKVSVRHYDAEGTVELGFAISGKASDIQIDKVFKDNSKWDLTNQNQGTVQVDGVEKIKGEVILPGGGTDTSLQLFKKYQNIDLTVTAKENDTTGEKFGRTDVLFEFDLNNDGSMDKNVSFGIVQLAGGRCVVQTLGWDKNYIPEKRINELYELDYAETLKYKSEGVQLRVVRYETNAYVYVDGKQVTVFDLTQNNSGVKADSAATVTLRHYDAVADKIVIPFTVTDQVAKPDAAAQENPVFKPNYKWDLSQQDLGTVTVNGVEAQKGVVSLPGGGTNAVVFYDQFVNIDLTITAKENKAPTAANGGRTDILFEFENGKNVSFGILKWSATSGCIIETLGNSTNHIPANRKNTLYTLNAAETASYLTEGVELRVMRYGTDVYVFCEGKQVAVFDLTQNNSGVTADMKATVSLRHYDAVADRVDIPFTVTNQVTEPEEEPQQTPVFKPNNKWDLTNQNQGMAIVDGVEKTKGEVSLPGGGTNTVVFYDQFTDMDLTVIAKENAADGAARGRTDVLFEFENGKNISFGVLCTKAETGECWVQALNSANDTVNAGKIIVNRFKGFYKLNEEEAAKYNDEGLALRIVRNGTTVLLFLDGKQVAVCDLTQNNSGVTADMKATVSLRHYDAVADRVDIPFTVTDELIKVTITDNSVNGKVVADSDAYVVGAEVVLTAEAEGYDLQSLKIDGEDVQVNADGTYRFVATKSNYTVEGTFRKAIFKAGFNTALWDISSQHDGYVFVKGGGGASDKPLQFAGQYQNVDLTLNARDYQEVTSKSRTEFGFEFDVDGDGIIDTTKGDQTVTFGIAEGDRIQTRAGTILDWKTPYDLTQAEKDQLAITAAEVAAGNEDGLDLRVVRYGTMMYLFVEGKQVAVCDLTRGKNGSTTTESGITADTKMFIYLRHYDDLRTDGVKIPFSISTEVEPVAFNVQAENGTVSTASTVNHYVNNGRTTTTSDIHFLGEKIVLSVKPNADNKITGVTLDSTDVLSQMVAGDNGAMVYSFVADKATYNIAATFGQDKIFEDNYNTGLWDISGQHDGYVTVIGGGGASDKPLQFVGQYQNVDLTLNARDYQEVTSKSRTEFGFEFDVDGDGIIDTAKGDQTVTFGIAEGDRIQTRGGTILDWKTPYDLNAAEKQQLYITAEEIAAGNEDGLDLRVVRYGTMMYLFVEGKQVAVCDLTRGKNGSTTTTNGITADTKMFIYLRHYDDLRSDGVKIPFSISTDVAPVEFAVQAENGTVSTVSKVNHYVDGTRIATTSDVHFAGEKVTLTVTPAQAGHIVKELLINGTDVSGAITANADGSYTYILDVSENAYIVKAKFTEIVYEDVYGTGYVPVSGQPVKTTTSFASFPRTIEVTFNRSSKSGRMILLGNCGGSSNDYFNLECPDNENIIYLNMCLGGTSYQHSFNTISYATGEDVRVTVVIEDAAVKCYVNGVLAQTRTATNGGNGSKTMSALWASVPNANLSNLWGMGNDLRTYPFVGTIYDIALWSDARTAEEIAGSSIENLASAGYQDNLLAAYNFCAGYKANEAQAEFAKDLSGNGNHLTGTLNVGTSDTKLSFDVDSTVYGIGYVPVSGQQVKTTTSFASFPRTIEVTFNRSSKSGRMILLGNCGGSSNDYFNLECPNNENIIYLNMCLGGTSYQHSFNTISYATGEDVRVTVVIEDAAVKCYVNGVLAQTRTATNGGNGSKTMAALWASVPNANLSNLWGIGNDLRNYPFAGTIYDIALWSDARTAEEIAGSSIENLASAVYQDNLLAAYNFRASYKVSEAQAKFAKDLSGNGNHLTGTLNVVTSTTAPVASDED